MNHSYALQVANVTSNTLTISHLLKNTVIAKGKQNKLNIWHPQQEKEHFVLPVDAWVFPLLYQFPLATSTGDLPRVHHPLLPNDGKRLALAPCDLNKHGNCVKKMNG